MPFRAGLNEAERRRYGDSWVKLVGCEPEPRGRVQATKGVARHPMGGDVCRVTLGRSTWAAADSAACDRDAHAGSRALGRADVLAGVNATEPCRERPPIW